MESLRSMLFIGLLVVTYMLYQQWQLDYAPQPVPQATNSSQATEQATSSSDDFVPASSAANTPAAVSTVAAQQLIEVETDVLKVKINTRGGDIVEVTLLDYETEQGSGIPFTIMQNGQMKYIAQSGLTGANGIDRTVKGRPVYQVAQQSYSMTDGQPLVVAMQYVDNAGLTVTKTYTFDPSSYSVGLEYQIQNNLSAPASVQMYGQLKQSSYVDNSSGLIPTYRGAAYSTKEERYEKYDFEDIADANLNKTTQGGWVAMLQHYFVSAWIPAQNEANQLYTSYTSAGDAVIGFKAPTINIDANSTATTLAKFYIGPKDQDALEQLADGLDLTVDYGFLFMISKPLFWLLVQIQSLVSNWGIAIIIITIIVKGAMYPLTKAQYTSMARMRELQPKMQQLKERFGDDRQKMGQATMELYRKEKVNPAGGCLPILIQMPIFLALYWVFLESVELRHAEFGLWLTDLSSKDPYYVLPVLMGLSMFIMQKMTPMTVTDPMQQKMMQYMPLVFTIFFFWFPSGLVLYWLVSNIISIIQMKIIFSGLEKAKAS
ncbi:MAG: membrane protein insertase YidC [Thalassotalea sp.]|nr:membrane protein insertase YidC [Thalassotalea sp.]